MCVEMCIQFIFQHFDLVQPCLEFIVVEENRFLSLSRDLKMVVLQHHRHSGSHVGAESWIVGHYCGVIVVVIGAGLFVCACAFN